MKRKFMAIVLAAACVTLTACDNGNGSGSGSSSVVSDTAATPAEKTSQLMGAVEFPEMRKLETADDFTANFGTGINLGDLTDHSVYICPSGMSPDEFGVLVAKDEATAASLKTAIEKRIQDQSDTFRDYPLAAEQVYKLDDAFVEISGNTVYYAICADNTKAREILG